MTSIEQQTARASEADPTTPIHEQVAAFHGNPHRVLIELLKDPEKPMTEIVDSVGVHQGTYWSWRTNIPGYAGVIDTIREQRHALRREAALAIIEAHTVPITERMVKRAEGDGRDSQRAGERLLETTSVLSASGGSASAVPVRVVTHTYILVESASGPPLADVVVESVTKELLPPKEG